MLILFAAFLLLLLYVLIRFRNMRRPIILAMLFATLPYIATPLLFPESLEIAHQNDSVTRLTSNAILGAIVVSGLTAMYYLTVRRFVTPAINPLRFKLRYIFISSILTTLLVLIGQSPEIALVIGAISGLGIALALRNRLIWEALFSGLGFGLLYTAAAIAGHHLSPSIIDDLWLAKNTSGITFLTLPISHVIVLFLFGLLWGPLYTSIKDSATPLVVPTPASPVHMKRVMSVASLLAGLLITGWFSFYFVLKPQAVTADQNNAALVPLNEAIRLTFERPIDRISVRPAISPEIPGTWEMEDWVLQNRLFKTLVFTPNQAFLPGQEYTISVQDMRTLAWQKPDNYSYSFSAEPLPKVTATTPRESAQEVAVCEPLTVQFEQPLSDYWKPEFTIEPKLDITTSHNDSTYTIKPNSCLEQGTEYTVTMRSELLSSLQTDTVLARTRFRTKSAPGLSGHSPQGSAVLTSIANIEFTFTHEMKPEAPDSYVAISPALKGSWIWEQNGNKLRYALSEPLNYGTRYAFTLKKGLPDKSGGYLTGDTTATFTTIGPVTITKSSPALNSQLVQVTTPIQIQFNQTVDQSSTQEHFSIEPAIAGYFKWSGNQLTFRPNSQFAYSTTYTYQIKAGVKSAQGGPDLAKDYTASFTTKLPPPTPIIFGYSEAGRPISGYIFGSGEEVIFIFGAIHGGKERSSGLILERLVDEIGQNPGQVASRKTIIIVPITNPDGYLERGDKFNSHGVNLNLNFATSGWQDHGGQNNDFAGNEPWSEKESRVIRDIALKYGASKMIAMHSKGSLVNPESHEPSRELARFYIRLSGYAYYEDVSWDYYGTATRWFVETVGGAAITVELASDTVPDWSRNQKALFGLVQ